jgi:hypothetical protein
VDVVLLGRDFMIERASIETAAGFLNAGAGGVLAFGVSSWLSWLG